MNDQNKAEKTWWQRNKKKVCIATGMVATGVLAYIGIKNKDALFNIAECGISALRAEKNVSIPEAIDDCSSALTNTEIDKCSETVSNIVRKKINSGEPYAVRSHPRYLGENRYPSAEKVKSANLLGIVLGPHETYVNEYMKNIA